MASFSDIIERLKEILKDANLKYTSQREIILLTLFNNKRHFTPEELLLQISKDFPNLKIGIATVYRALNLLEENKLVSSITFGKDGKKYELNRKEHHDHMICDECGKIIEFHNEMIEEAQNKIAKEHNFKLTTHTMQLHGICKECIKTRGKN